MSRIYLPLQIVGTTLVVVAVALVYLPAGLLVGGAAMTAFGVALERSSTSAE